MHGRRRLIQQGRTDFADIIERYVRYAPLESARNDEISGVSIFVAITYDWDIEYSLDQCNWTCERDVIESCTYCSFTIVKPSDSIQSLTATSSPRRGAYRLANSSGGALLPVASGLYHLNREYNRADEQHD